GLAALAKEKNVILVSDEIYSSFTYDKIEEPKNQVTEGAKSDVRFFGSSVLRISPAAFNDRTLVIDGFSKSHGMTGWRLGYVHGPAEMIETIIKVRQNSVLCTPAPAP